MKLPPSWLLFLLCSAETLNANVKSLQMFIFFFFLTVGASARTCSPRRNVSATRTIKPLPDSAKQEMMLRRCVAVAVHVVVHVVSIAESAEFFSNAVFRITQIIQQIRLNARIDGRHFLVRYVLCAGSVTQRHQSTQGKTKMAERQGILSGQSVTFSHEQ